MEKTFFNQPKEKEMKAIVILVLSFAFGSTAIAHEGEHALNEVCIAECPNAKDESEAMKCMEGLAAKKKNDKKFRKTDCFAAYKEHAGHGKKEDGHSH